MPEPTTVSQPGTGTASILIELGTRSVCIRICILSSCLQAEGPGDDVCKMHLTALVGNGDAVGIVRARRTRIDGPRTIIVELLFSVTSSDREELSREHGKQEKSNERAHGDQIVAGFSSGRAPSTDPCTRRTESSRR